MGRQVKLAMLSKAEPKIAVPCVSRCVDAMVQWLQWCSGAVQQQHYSGQAGQRWQCSLQNRTRDVFLLHQKLRTESENYYHSTVIIVEWKLEENYHNTRSLEVNI